MCLSSFIVGAHKVAAIVNMEDVVIAFSPQLIDSLPMDDATFIA